MKKQFQLILFVSIFLISCNPTYIPNVVNAPIFSNKREFQVRMIVGASGFNPQFSYAITDHWGAMLNASFIASDTSTQNPQNFIELGTGYYNNVNGRFVYEIFTGFGKGTAFGNIETVQLGKVGANSEYTRFYIQPAAGLVTDLFDISLATRFVGVSVNPEVETDLKTSAGFFEPAISLGVGFKYVKIHSQFGFSVSFENESQLAFQYQNIMFNLGVVGRIGRKYY